MLRQAQHDNNQRRPVTLSLSKGTPMLRQAQHDNNQRRPVTLSLSKGASSGALV
jgi:hypothetical protein